MKIFQKRAKILDNFRITGNYYKLILQAEAIAQTAKPGQFVMLKVTESYQPLLRRPFSIHRLVYSPQSIVHSWKENLKANCIEILYEVVGKGTKILLQKKVGEYLDTIGPLGSGFDLTPNTYNLTPILVAGGIGVAPILFLAEHMIKRLKVKSKRLKVLIGAKTKKEILCKKEFAKLDCNVKISTNDGSAGFKGKVTELLKHLLSTMNYQLSTIYACGPKLMLKEIATISKKYKIPAQISLEEHMACGIGVCLGCAVNTKEGYKRVCKEGPVFDASTINFNG